MTPYGYILYCFYNKQTKDHIKLEGEWHPTKKEMLDVYMNHLDDKWDCSFRKNIHYFYYDVSENEYIPLEKWKKNDRTHKGTELSTIFFKNKKQNLEKQGYLLASEKIKITTTDGETFTRMRGDWETYEEAKKK